MKCVQVWSILQTKTSNLTAKSFPICTNFSQRPYKEENFALFFNKIWGWAGEWDDHPLTPIPAALLNTICHILSQPFCIMSHDICDKLKYKMPNVQVGMTQNMSNSAQD